MNIPKEILELVIYEDYEDGDVTVEMDLNRCMKYTGNDVIIGYESTSYENKETYITVWTETHVHTLISTGFGGDKYFISTKRNPPVKNYLSIIKKIEQEYQLSSAFIADLTTAATRIEGIKDLLILWNYESDFSERQKTLDAIVESVDDYNKFSDPSRQD